MSVEFNDESQQQKASMLYAKFQSSNQVPGIEQWLIKKGIVSTPQAANAVLLGVAIISFALAGFFMYKAVGGPSAPELTPEELQIMEEDLRLMEANI